MLELQRKSVVCALVMSALTLSGCSSSGSDSSSSLNAEAATSKFDVRVDLPAESKSLGMDSNAALLFAIETRAFETEYSDSDFHAPHRSAWDRWDLFQYVNEGPNSKTISCSDIAKNQIGESGGGHGSVTVKTTLREDYVGYVEQVFDGCVINQQAYTGTRRIRVTDGRQDEPYGEPAVSFQWEYENYYWGTGGLNYFIDGKVAFEEIQPTEGADYSYYKPYKSTSNYRFASRQAFRYSVGDLVTRCGEVESSALDNDYSWRCDVQSGKIGLQGKGEYSVKSLSPIRRSVWVKEAKLEIVDDDGNALVYWGDGNEKRATLVNSNSQEQTFAVAYESSAFTELQASAETEPSLSFTALETRFKRWGKELYSSDSDEFVFFDVSDPRYVDAIGYTNKVQRRIDLVEPAYDINVISQDETLMSGHDGGTRRILLRDPSEHSAHQPIGLGKIIEVHDDRVVSYQVPGTTERARVSYRWRNDSQSVIDTKSMGSAGDVFDFKNGDYATSSGSYLEVGTDRPNDYQTRHLNVGETHGFLKFFDNDILLTGGGVLIKCSLRCVDDASYWKSANEAISAKYPALGSQIVVTATTDTEGYYRAANVLILATKSAADWQGSYDQPYPLSADHLWAIDLNDMRRVAKLELPKNQFSSPSVALKIRELKLQRRNGNDIVGIGSWGLDSGRDNTVLFGFDLAQVSFD